MKRVDSIHRVHVHWQPFTHSSFTPQIAISEKLPLDMIYLVNVIDLSHPVHTDDNSSLASLFTYYTYRVQKRGMRSFHIKSKIWDDWSTHTMDG